MTIGIGEAGISRNDDISALSTRNASPSRKGTKNLSPDEQSQKMTEIVDSLVMDKCGKKTNTKNSDKTPLELQPLSELMKLYDMYMRNFKFHKEKKTMT